MAEKVLDVIKKLKEQKKRKFSQSFDLIVHLSSLDLKKPESKLNEEFKLPYGWGEDSKVGIFSDGMKSVTDATVISSSELDKLGKDKSIAKKIIKNTDFFLAEAKMMPVVGKALGQLLAPRGLMPKILTGDPKVLVENLKKSVRIRIKDSPVIQCKVGKESMKDEDVAENVKAVLKHLETRLPKGRANINKVWLKLTMSEPMQIEVG